jgi:hypothetical protein
MTDILHALKRFQLGTPADREALEARLRERIRLACRVCPPLEFMNRKE